MTPLHHHSHHHGGPVPASVVHAAHHGFLPFHIPLFAGFVFMVILAAVVLGYTHALLAWVLRRMFGRRSTQRQSRRQPQTRYSSNGY